jgi:hypothetical protein
MAASFKKARNLLEKNCSTKKLVYLLLKIIACFVHKSSACEKAQENNNREQVSNPKT